MTEIPADQLDVLEYRLEGLLELREVEEQKQQRVFLEEQLVALDLVARDIYDLQIVMKSFGGDHHRLEHGLVGLGHDLVELVVSQPVDESRLSHCADPHQASPDVTSGIIHEFINLFRS